MSVAVEDHPLAIRSVFVGACRGLPIRPVSMAAVVAVPPAVQQGGHCLVSPAFVAPPAGSYGRVPGVPGVPGRVYRWAAEEHISPATGERSTTSGSCERMASISPPRTGTPTSSQ